jgi:hypothetical protein
MTAPCGRLVAVVRSGADGRASDHYRFDAERRDARRPSWLLRCLRCGNGFAIRDDFCFAELLPQVRRQLDARVFGAERLRQHVKLSLSPVTRASRTTEGGVEEFRCGSGY